VFGAGGGELHGPARAGAASDTSRAAAARKRIGVILLADLIGSASTHISHAAIKGLARV
jgi:hypothetical protein